MAKRREKTGIYIDLQHLFRIIYAGQFEMNKRDRACTMIDITGKQNTYTRKYLQKFLCTTNSYFGLLKHRYEYKNIMRLWDHISDERKEYVYLDLKTMSIQVNMDNSYHNNIKYNFGRITA